MRKSIDYIEQAIDRFGNASALARAIGVSPPTIHNWMQRGAPPDWKVKGEKKPKRWEDIIKAAKPKGEAYRKSTRHGLRKKEVQDVQPEQSIAQD